jgi:type IV pilus assembly protein PilY1
LGNVYIYGGTGRYLSEADKSNTDAQYLFGIKDPFFNSDDERSSYYHDYDGTLSLATSNLFDADPYIVSTTGLVFDDGTGLSRIIDWQTLLDVVRNTEDQTSYPDYYDGWIRSLAVPGERVLTKGALLGGIVITASFLPTDDPCGFGGDSYLYGLYYETGTAYFNPVFIEQGTTTVTVEEQEVVKILEIYDLGRGKSSGVSAHLGREEGAMGYVQQSTGAVTGVKIKPAFSVKSSMRSWQED